MNKSAKKSLSRHKKFFLFIKYAINYDYFIKSISQDAVIYITDDENVSYNNYIVGCCTLIARLIVILQ